MSAKCQKELALKIARWLLERDCNEWEAAAPSSAGKDEPKPEAELSFNQERKVENPGRIIPPCVLGANILAFLPGEDKSYTHCFANQGIPTHIRIIKDIETTEAVQLMTPEDDALDTRLFCERVMARHGRPVTLNGFCQGGYMTTLAILSGEPDGPSWMPTSLAWPLSADRAAWL